MDLKETDILGPDVGKHWYYSSKAKAMVRLLGGRTPARILDVGAGSGFFSRYLLSNSTAQEACCVDPGYDAEFDEVESGKPIRFKRSIGTSNADLVLLMDVLEHVDDDTALLREYVQKVPSGCRFLITVPAFEFLWSGHDDFLEHRRRYTLPHLEDVVRNSGLTVARGSYYFGMVFPLAASIRLAGKALKKGSPARSQMTRHHPMVNATLKTLCSIELPAMPFNRAAGLSVFCLAEKA